MKCMRITPVSRIDTHFDHKKKATSVHIAQESNYAWLLTSRIIHYQVMNLKKKRLTHECMGMALAGRLLLRKTIKR